MMFYKNAKIIICSSDGNNDLVDIVAGVLQEYTFAPFQFIISLNLVLQTSIDLMKENSFKLKQKGKKQKLLRMQTTQMI